MLMLLAGMIDKRDKMQTANLINSIFSSTGKKVSIIDSKSITGLSPQMFKKYIRELEKNNIDVLIFKINIFDSEDKIFDQLYFDIIIFSDKTDGIKEINLTNFNNLMDKLFSRLDEKGIVIVNVDDYSLIEYLYKTKYHTITYGFNSKASIAASSIGDIVFKNNFLCCLQKTISAKNGLIMQPQEYMINIKSNELDAYDVLAAASFAIVNGVDLNLVN